MSGALLHAAQIWLMVLLAGVMAVIVRARSTTRRILALDLASIILIAVLVLFSFDRASAYYLDAALVLGLLGFVATLRLARHVGEEEVNE